MAITIDLPEELASRLADLLPAAERDRFAISAIAEALTARLQERDAQLAASLMAELDPEKEPEREAAEYIAIIEEGLEDADAGRNLISLEEARRQWEEEKRAADPQPPMSDQNPIPDEPASYAIGTLSPRGAPISLPTPRKSGRLLCSVYHHRRTGAVAGSADSHNFAHSTRLLSSYYKVPDTRH